MDRKPPDTLARRELCELNHGFLELVRAERGAGAAYGLDLAVRQRLALLTEPQLQAVAETPCLLAGFALLPARTVPARVARGVADGDARPAGQPEAARLYAAALLAWLWHAARRDRLLAALCIGPGSLAVEQLRQAGFRDLQRMAASAADHLEARFCRHPRLWPDLVRAACGPDTQLLAATRLSIVQLTLVSRH